MVLGKADRRVILEFLRDKIQTLTSVKGTDGVRTRDLRFTRPTPYHLATAPMVSSGNNQTEVAGGGRLGPEKKIGSGGIRTHASEETGALNQRLRPLGHATSMAKSEISYMKIHSSSSNHLIISR